ncbi:MAG: ABC transporter ATP-binding protein [Acidobacteria bacterium]|nr:MAG: ABC transporter ATP-binding protein [Acidobacteriota bacterium]
MQRNMNLQHELGVVRSLLPFLQRYKWLLPVVVVLGLLAAVMEGASLSLLVPLLHVLTDHSRSVAGNSSLVLRFQNVMDVVPPEWQLLCVVLAIFVAICFKNLISYADVTAFSYVESRVSHDLRVRLFTRILNVPYANLEDFPPGYLMNLLETETWHTSQALKALFSAVTSACTAVIFVPLLFLLSWRLAIVALLSIATLPFIVSLVTREMRALGERAVGANSDLATRMWSSLNGLRVIHLFGREDFERKCFEDSSRAARDISLRQSLILARNVPAGEILITAIIAGLALLVQAHLIDIATLSAFILVLYRLHPRVRNLVSSRVSIAGFEGPVLAVTRFLNGDITPPARSDALCPASWRTIRFEGVTFRFNGQRAPALDNVSFEICRGATVAIVGSSGAGKSTLIDLLLGFRDAQGGLVAIDGTAMNDLDRGAWRSKFAVVNQDPYIFDETVRFNILYGQPGADQRDVLEAAELACADPFIRGLPKGYDTLVGERGVRLSGGEQQRLVLARALVRKPDVLVLDEATNALDSVTEQAFQQALARFTRDHTVIIVAHRLSTIQQADHILVLHQGKLVEQGSFSSLLAGNGLFARMYELQSYGQTTEYSGVATG